MVRYGFFLLAFLGTLGPGSLAATEVERLSAAGDVGRYTFRLSTPSVEVLPGPDGGKSIRIADFGALEQRPGVPDLPSRSYRVAIPGDAIPRLEYSIRRQYVRRGIVPVPVADRVPVLSEGDLDRIARDDAVELQAVGTLRRSTRATYRRDPEVYEREGTYPAEPVWLGDVGSLRSQRYVEVHVAPARFDPSLGGLRIATELEITVHFDGVDATVPAPKDLRLDPAFESVYRNSFLNYAQGLRFRSRPGPATGSGGGSGRAATSSGTGVRIWIPVEQDGIVRLTYDAVIATGINTKDVYMWGLENRGFSVPLQIMDDGDGLLEPGEWVQFYGQALLDEPKAILDTDLPNSDVDIWEAGDFTDRNVYLLTADHMAEPLVPTREAGPAVPVRTPEPFFIDTAHREEDLGFRPIGGADAWYWTPTLNANNPLYRSRTDTVDLPGLHDGTEPAQIRVKQRGFTNLSGTPQVDQTHVMKVTLTNSDDEVLTTDNDSFEGRTLFVQDFGWTHTEPGPQLSDPVEITYELFTVTGVSINQVALDWIEIDYARSFTALGDRLEFTWPDGDAEFVVDGLLTNDVEVFELRTVPGSPVVEPVKLTGALVEAAVPPAVPSFTIRFRMDEDPAIVNGEPRRFLVVGQGDRQVPGAGTLELDVESDLRDPGNQADLIVIGHPSLLDDAPGTPLRLLLDHRATPQGGGLTSKVVSLDDLEDDFNFGLPGPPAIREFLRFVLSDAPGEGWSDPRPSYVMLIGDSSYDYKSGVTAGTYVPTQIIYKDELELGYYSSDSHLASVVGGDSLADLVVGRLPARDLTQAEMLLQKILDYETVAADGAWSRHALAISDRGTGGEGNLDFETTNAFALSHIGSQPYSSQHLRYYTDYFTNGAIAEPKEDMRFDIKRAVNGAIGPAGGAALLQYGGHGNYIVWSNDAFFDERIPVLPDTRDTEDLENALTAVDSRLPWILAHNCLTGGFHSCPSGDCATTAPNTMGEDWLNHPTGGAIGVFSPSGLSFNFLGNTVTGVLWPAMFGDRKERTVGALVLETLAEICSTVSGTEGCQNYILLGDPSMRLRLYAVDPPTELQAVGGNSLVDLSWAPSSTPGAVYEVWRSPDLSLQNPFYSKLNVAPIVGTTFSDTDAENASTYYYRVVAVDPDAFRSRWSNFNSDCIVDGPDCVEATPLNPQPPVTPTGVAIADPGTGSSLDILWDANPEDDLLRYDVHYGFAPGVYDFTVSTGSPGVTLRELIEGQTYYVAVSATNTSMLSSGNSLEVSERPIVARGLRAPNFVSDLMLSSVADDVLLEWTEIVTDIFGKPKSVAVYEILRGTVEDFSVAASPVFATCVAPCSSFLDVGAMTSGSRYHYRVVARDSDNTRGGVGSQLPDWTNLRVDKIPGETPTLSLTWDPVTTTLDGDPLQLQHYAVYSSTSPFGREDVRDGVVTDPQLSQDSELSLPLTGETRYYSVLAVDIRQNASPY